MSQVTWRWRWTTARLGTVLAWPCSVAWAAGRCANPRALDPLKPCSRSMPSLLSVHLARRVFGCHGQRLCVQRGMLLPVHWDLWPNNSS